MLWQLRFKLGPIGLATILLGGASVSGDEPSREAAVAALQSAVGFFHQNCSKHGGYVWRVSRDLKLSEGEAETGLDTIWVQPPGTPAVGLVLLDAYETTGDQYYLDAATEAAHALVRGQMQSGGWYYSIHFDPEERKKWGYRDNSSFRPSRRKKNKTNVTTLDDDTTPAAVRFLARIDKLHNFRDQSIHQAASFALEALLLAQYPNGGWYQNWDKYPQSKDRDEFPILRASYPDSWSRKWLNDWPGRYFTNDNVAGMMIETMLVAWETYDDQRYLQSARRTGGFLILAQMPQPQPAWAQQYDPQMHPCWDRKMEPPAISSWESQAMMEALLLLYRKTDDERFLKPIPDALAYLKKSRLADGRLARFYELQTNRPLYMNKEYQLTYNADDAPTHYGWIMESRLEQIEAQYNALRRGGAGAPLPEATSSDELAEEVTQIIAALDSRGAWIDKRGMRGFRKASQEGVMQSETFIRNVTTLCQFIRFAGRE